MTETPIQRRLFFEGQLLHLISLIALLVALYFASLLPGFKAGSFMGLSTSTWAAFAVGVAVLHQVYVWLCWRLELDGQRLTHRFGDQTFRLYQTGFAILFILRPILAFALGWSNRNSLPAEPWVGYTIAVILMLPAIYLMFCVRRYFGFKRAFGIDHFDVSYRDMPLVRKGIFKWTPNAMYVFGFFILWVPAFLFQSVSALMVAAFSHLYIWVHYYCTEQPDIRRIYG
ncbi:MAG: methyltransferase [Rhizobiaceae bacterium]